jgi:hypothetical protein
VLRLCGARLPQIFFFSLSFHVSLCVVRAGVRGGYFAAFRCASPRCCEAQGQCSRRSLLWPSCYFYFLWSANPECFTVDALSFVNHVRDTIADGVDGYDYVVALENKAFDSGWGISARRGTGGVTWHSRPGCTQNEADTSLNIPAVLVMGFLIEGVRIGSGVGRSCQLRLEWKHRAYTGPLAAFLCRPDRT